MSVNGNDSTHAEGRREQLRSTDDTATAAPTLHLTHLVIAQVVVSDVLKHDGWCSGAKGAC